MPLTAPQLKLGGRLLLLRGRRSVMNIGPTARGAPPAATDDGRYSLRCAPPALANAGAKVAAATRATDDENFISVARVPRARSRESAR